VIDSSDTEIDTDTDTEGVESSVPNFISLMGSKWTDVFELECSVNLLLPAYPLLLTSLAALIVHVSSMK